METRQQLDPHQFLTSSILQLQNKILTGLERCGVAWEYPLAIGSCHLSPAVLPMARQTQVQTWL